MKIKMGEIINFGYFYDEVKNKKLSFKVLYNLSKLSKAADEQLAFYREKFQEILNEYGDKDENGNLIPTADGNGIQLKPNTEQECYNKVAELQAVEVELPDISFTIDDFNGVELTMEVFNLIAPFIKE